MNTDTDESQIVEGQVVEDGAEEGQTGPRESSDAIPQDVSVLTNLEDMIKNHVTGIDSRKAESKKYQEMLSDMCTNDPTFQQHDKIAKDALKVKSSTRKQILSQPAAKQTISKLQELKAEVKEMTEALSDYLREYERLSGSNEIEGEDGEVREIVYSARLVKKSSKYRE